jgi:hypothetical protein
VSGPARRGQRASIDPAGTKPRGGKRKPERGATARGAAPLRCRLVLAGQGPFAGQSCGGGRGRQRRGRLGRGPTQNRRCRATIACGKGTQHRRATFFSRQQGFFVPGQFT